MIPNLCLYAAASDVQSDGLEIAVFQSLGPSFDALKDIQRLVPKPLLRCLGSVLSVVVLLEGERSPQSDVLSTLEQVFIKELSVLGTLSSFPRS